MRIDVEKYLLVGPHAKKEAFFKRIQELAIVEFIHFKPLNIERGAEIETLQEALHILRQKAQVAQNTFKDVRTALVIARDIVEKNEELERAFEEKRILAKEIARIEVFGDFSLNDIREIEKETKRNIQFFFTKKSKEIEAPTREEVFYVGSRYGLDYYMSINSENRSYLGMIEIPLLQSLSTLQGSLAEIERRIDTLQTELSLLAHHKKLIQEGLLDALNRFHLTESKQRIEEHLGKSLFSAYGWVPKNKIAALEKLCEQLDVYCAAVAIEKEERVPTYLENRGAGRLGEDLVNIYDTPSPKDKDPSPWVFWAFGLFFSMIIGDAGYGVLLLIISLFLMYKFGKKSKMIKRVLTLSTSLSVGCIIWGVVTASYFGINIPIDSKVRSASFINWMVKEKAEYVIKYHPSIYDELVKQEPKVAQANTPQTFLKAMTKGEGKKVSYTIYDEFSDNALLEIVIFIGALHIMLSFMRHLKENWAGVGWIVFMIGAYLYFPSLLMAISLIHYIFHVPLELGAAIGLYLVFIGIAVATILALIQKKWGGLVEPMLVIQVFADVMSYLRIYALGLAGVMMASTFNDIAGRAPLIFGILIIFAGHTVNFILALMGGLIHGLRLNFIEWYHYSFEGGGKMWNPLALLKSE